MRITRNEKLEQVFTRYDLEIQGTHNFVAEGVVVHNTSAHINWKKWLIDVDESDYRVTLFSGGENYDRFAELFSLEDLYERFRQNYGLMDITVYGEAYGGKQQGMAKTYGPNLKFAAFDVKIGESWLSVPQAHDVCTKLGLEFVDYVLIDCTIENIDAERDKPSTQAWRNGMGDDKLREGIVLHPLFECTLNNGSRVIAKHKRDEFRETKSPKTVDPEKQKMLEDAQAIADEWVTAMRLEHVVQRIVSERDNKTVSIEDTGKVISAMVEDVTREAEGEIADNKNVRKAIGTIAAKMFKNYLAQILHS